MNEIYWLTRLDDVKLLIGFTIAFAVTVLVFGIGSMGLTLIDIMTMKSLNTAWAKKLQSLVQL